MKVKDMSRSQQKAVFANMGNSGSKTKLWSVEKFHARRNLMIKKHDLTEETEDKLYRVWQNKKLTYRQKMIKIAEIKKVAAKKLKKEEQKAGISTQNNVKESVSKKFKKSSKHIEITNIPTKGASRDNLDALIIKKKFPKNVLYSHRKLLLTQNEYREGLKNNKKSLSSTRVPKGLDEKNFNAFIYERKPKKDSYFKIDGLILSQKTYQKALKRNVRVRYPEFHKKENPAGKKPNKEQKTTFVSNKLANVYAKHKIRMGYNVRVIKEKPQKGKFGFYSIDNWTVYFKK